MEHRQKYDIIGKHLKRDLRLVHIGIAPKVEAEDRILCILGKQRCF
jgi:hypothetical protein